MLGRSPSPGMMMGAGRRPGRGDTTGVGGAPARDGPDLSSWALIDATGPEVYLGSPEPKDSLSWHSSAPEFVGEPGLICPDPIWVENWIDGTGGGARWVELDGKVVAGTRLEPVEGTGSFLLP